MNAPGVTLYIAASLDGFVADEDGGVGWLEEYGGEAADGDAVESYEEFFASVDCLVVGARTYEQILGFGEWPYGDRPTYVLTSGDPPRATDSVEFLAGDVETVAADLRRRHDHIWLVGGAQVAQAFLRERQVDELRLSLVPLLLVSGIPLFGSDGERQGLRLLDTATRESGIVELRYRLSG